MGVSDSGILFTLRNSPTEKHKYVVNKEIKIQKKFFFSSDLRYW